MKQYKVLSQKDKWYSGKFDPEALEKALNSYASQGFAVIAATTASIPGIMGGTRDEMVIILERDDTRQAETADKARRLMEAASKSFDIPAPQLNKSSGDEPPVYSL